MAIARSVAQGEFEIEYERIAAKRNREAGLMAWIDSISAISTALVLMDVFGIAGFSLSLVFTLSLTAVAFFLPIAIAIGCAVICSIFIVSDSIYRRDSELEAMDACAELAKAQAHELEELMSLLEKLLARKEDIFLRERYEKLRLKNVDDVAVAVLEINGHLKSQLEDRLRDQVLPRAPQRVARVAKKINQPSYGLAKVIALFSGIGFIWGIGASIIGGAALTALLLTPAGIAVVSAVLVMSIIIGVASYIDYQCRVSQQAHMDELVSEESALKDTIKNIEMAKTLTIWALDVSRPSAVNENSVDGSPTPELGERNILSSPAANGLYAVKTPPPTSESIDGYDSGNSPVPYSAAQ